VPIKRLSRRELIAGVSLAGAGLLVAATGCAPAPAPSPTSAPAKPTAGAAPTPTTATKSAMTTAPVPTGSPTVPTSATASPVASGATPSAPAKVSGQADLAVVKGASAADITRAAVDAIGGMARFVKSGQTVMLKPNMCTAMPPEYAATTNPEVVATLVAMCKEAGAARVKVFDYPWGSPTAYTASGIDAAVKAAGGEMIPITPLKWKKTDLPKAVLQKSQELYEDVLTADVLINVPIAKDHGMATLTLGMKNLMGVIQYREIIHSNFPVMLTDLAGFLKPALTVVDAVRILLRNGPTGGSLDDVQQLNTVIASADIVAADAYATTLFGMDALRDIPYIKYAAEHGLGRADLKALDIKEISVG
jgi:uncharacterized protein (DUF362 family)